VIGKRRHVVVVVVLPVVQREFGAEARRGYARLYAHILGFGSAASRRANHRSIPCHTEGLGRLCREHRFLGMGYVAAGLSSTLWQIRCGAFLIGLGTRDIRAADGGPRGLALVERYRRLAVTIVASGNISAERFV